MSTTNAAKPAPPAQKPAPVPTRVSRMTLANITKGRQGGPFRIGLFGVDGVGKSTFGADAPAPIFQPTEDRLRHIDAEKLPIAATWQEVIDGINMLTAEQHNWKTYILDTVDWAEPLLVSELCRREGVKTRDDIGGGFQKWIDRAIEEWRVLLAALERLQTRRGLNVLLVGHAIANNFKNPEGDDYDRFILKIQPKAWATIKEWLDAVYFARFESYAVKEGKNKLSKAKGVSTGERIMHTRWSAAFDAKDSYGLPETLPFSWSAFEQARSAATPEAMRADCEQKAKQIGGEVEAKTAAALEKAGKSMAALIQIRERLDELLAERAEAQQPPPADTDSK